MHARSAALAAIRAGVAFATILATAGLVLPEPARTRVPLSVSALADVERVATRRAGEGARIRRHFDSVLVELRAADGHALTAAQRAGRARQIARLAAYRDRGVFPRNEHFPDAVLPYFVDRSGTRCAVAHLMTLDGRDAIVRRVAATRNNAWVSALRDESGLAAWLEETGLTLEEAARIQVPYVGDPIPARASAASSASRVGTPYAAASAVGALASGAAIAYALRSDAPRRPVLAAGALAGAAGVALGAARLGDGGTARALGAANAAVGAAATAFALRALFHDAAEATVAQRERRVALAPVVGREVGFTLAARF